MLKVFSVIIERMTHVREYMYIFQGLTPESASNIVSATKQHPWKRTVDKHLILCLVLHISLCELTCLCFRFLSHEVGMEYVLCVTIEG